MTRKTDGDPDVQDRPGAETEIMSTEFKKGLVSYIQQKSPSFVK